MTPTSPGFPDRSVAVRAIIVLMLASLFSYLDRQLLTLLVQPIKADLGISDTQVGLLQGFSFALFFSIMAMPIGWLVDRAHRWRIAGVGIVLWSAATVASGFAQSFPALLVTRMCVGIGEAALMPVAFSLLADYFPPHQRGRAFSAFMMSVFAGGGGALIIGGAVLRALGDVALVDLGPFGVRPLWQAAFIIVGTPGFLVAAVFFMMREPARQDYIAPTGAAESPEAAMSFFRYFRANGRAFGLVWGAYTLLAFTAYCIIPWAPTLFTRQHGLSLATAGMTVGIAQLSMGLIGALIAGVLGDRWTASGKRGAKFRLTMVWWIGAIPAIALFTLTDNLTLAIIGFACFSLCNGIGYVSASAVIQDMVPGNMRGRTTAFWYLITGVLGNGGGPVATALATDFIYGRDSALPLSILTVTLPSLVIGLVLSTIGLTAYDRIRRRLAARSGPAVIGITTAG